MKIFQILTQIMAEQTPFFRVRNMAGTDKRFKHAVPHKTGTGECLGRMYEEEGQHRNARNNLGQDQGE